MTSGWLKSVWLVVACLAFTAGEVGAAEQRSPRWGGSGGTRSYNMDCGSGGVLVGVTGKSGTWIDQMGVMCRRIASDGSLGGYFTRGPYGGSGGTSSGTHRCDGGNVVRGISGLAGSYVHQLHIFCEKWNPARKRREGGTTKVPVFGKWGAFLSENKFFCSGSSAVVKALRGRYGGYIDSVQVVCDTWNR